MLHFLILISAVHVCARSVAVKAKHASNYTKNIEGWFIAESTVAHLFSELIDIDVIGPVVEIGVYHGKSFLFMASLAPKSVPVVAIDVFEDQSHNYDKAGEGNRAIVTKHMETMFGYKKGLFDRIKLHKENSFTMDPLDVLRITGSSSADVMFFSIDGCHTFNCTMKDLELASASLHPKGLIMVDDYDNVDWPGVALAVGAFLERRKGLFVAIAKGENKFYISRRGFSAEAKNIFRALCAKRALKFRDKVCSVHSNCDNAGGNLMVLRYGIWSSVM